ncbi:unnamed protein product [Xylocopa violacea]|uniref:Uncharacterized protein n=1 Tax=Xylocopa violacea TaxID=135666 RepID=A0ABP1NAS6_XYLVO
MFLFTNFLVTFSLGYDRPCALLKISFLIGYGTYCLNLPFDMSLYRYLPERILFVSCVSIRARRFVMATRLSSCVLGMMFLRGCVTLEMVATSGVYDHSFDLSATFTIFFSGAFSSNAHTFCVLIVARSTSPSMRCH